MYKGMNTDSSKVTSTNTVYSKLFIRGSVLYVHFLLKTKYYFTNKMCKNRINQYYI